MTPTVTQTGETVTVHLGDACAILSPSQAEEYADAVRMASVGAKREERTREAAEAYHERRAAFMVKYPDAVPVKTPSRWTGYDAGIGAFRIGTHGPVARVCWNNGVGSTEDINVIPEWPVPVQLRVEGGRTAHTWRGGTKGVCGAVLNRAKLPTANTKPCPRCAAIEAARGGAS